MLGYGVGTSIDEPDSISDGFYNITVDENTAIIVFRDATGSTNTENAARPSENASEDQFLLARIHGHRVHGL